MSIPSASPQVLDFFGTPLVLEPFQGPQAQHAQRPLAAARAPGDLGKAQPVEKARLLLNGEEVAKLPEEAKLVQINSTAGTLTITADGTKVYESKQQK